MSSQYNSTAKGKENQSGVTKILRLRYVCTKDYRTFTFGPERT